MRERLIFDKQGKELRRYEGVQKLPRGWAVTANYVIHTGSLGDIRVFDRATGKKLGDAKVGLRPFELYAITGNDVLLYDDRADELISGSLKLKRGNSREKIIDIYYYDCDAVDVCPACDGRFPG